MLLVFRFKLWYKIYVFQIYSEQQFFCSWLVGLGV